MGAFEDCRLSFPRRKRLGYGKVNQVGAMPKLAAEVFRRLSIRSLPLAVLIRSIQSGVALRLPPHSK